MIFYIHTHTPARYLYLSSPIPLLSLSQAYGCVCVNKDLFYIYLWPAKTLFFSKKKIASAYEDRLFLKIYTKIYTKKDNIKMYAN